MGVWPVLSMALCWASAASVLIMAGWLRRWRRLAQAQFEALRGAKVIIDAYIRQGKGLRCDVCGNEMEATEPVDLVQQRDGSFLVAHGSHRAHLWDT